MAFTGSLLSTGTIAAAPETVADDRADRATAVAGRVPAARGYQVAIDDTLYFAGSDSAGIELWKTDGTPEGTGRVADIYRGYGDSRPTQLTPFGEGLVFVASDGLGQQLWRSDGTAEGTVELAEPGGRLSHVAVVDDRVLFASTDEAGESTMWRSDGTSSGTVPVAPAASLSGRGAGYLPAFVTTDDTMFFTSYDDVHGRELWKSDGTTAGTGLVVDLTPGLDYYFYARNTNPSHLTTFGDEVFFAAGSQMWRSDGTADGTVRAVAGTDVQQPLGVVGPTLYFSQSSSQHAPELWKTDGTEAGTGLVEELDTTPRSAARVGDVLYFAADGDMRGHELWRTDGTTEGTRPVADISGFADDPSGSSIGELTPVADRLFFTADDGVHGRRLWTTDGSAGGTGLVPEEAGSTRPLAASHLTSAGDVLFHVGRTAQTAALGWRTVPHDVEPIPALTNLERPTIDGDVEVGGTLVADPGRWSEPGVTFNYVWRTDGATRHTGTDPTYQVEGGDQGFEFSVDVTASLDGFASRGASSEATDTVPYLPPPEPPPLVNEVPPKVYGTPRVGTYLLADTGTWSWDSGSYQHEWLVDGAPVPGATTSAFLVPPEAAGRQVRVRVTSGGADGPTAESLSQRVALGLLRPASSPAVSGVAKVGRVLRATPGRVVPIATRVTYQWLRNGTPIAGAVRATYTVPRKFRGARIAVRVTHLRPGYRSLPVTSAPTAKVAGRLRR